MFLTVERSPALLIANVFDFNAAVLIAFMLSARLELCTFLLTANVSTHKILARDLLFDPTTTALDVCTFGARWAFIKVTRFGTSVWRC